MFHFIHFSQFEILKANIQYIVYTATVSGCFDDILIRLLLFERFSPCLLVDRHHNHTFICVVFLFFHFVLLKYMESKTQIHSRINHFRIENVACIAIGRPS